MFNNLIDIAKSATSFLQSGVAPPNVDASTEEQLKDVNHLTSKKFFVVFTSVLLLCFFYFSSVAILFIVPHTPEIVTGFVTIFSKTMEILAIVIATYLGVQAAVDFKINSSSSSSIQSLNQTNNSTMTNNTNITETYELLTHNAKEDDYEIPVS